MQTKERTIVGIFVISSFWASLALAAAPVHISCSTGDSYGDAADISLSGNKIFVTFTDKVDAPTIESGYPSSDGGFYLDQGGFGCGKGVYLNVDQGLLDGSAAAGKVTVSFSGNYECEGETINYDCKSQ